MSFILNIETATEVCSVCISKGEQLLAFKETTEKNAHAGQITLLIEECLQIVGIKLAQLDAVAISHGPGSYTGLRVGTSTAKGICYALNKPLIAIDTLQALAAQTLLKEAKKALYIPMIDARRMEVYTAIFDDQNQSILPATALILEEDSFQKYLQNGHQLVLCGNGAVKCKDMLSHPNLHYSTVRCSSTNMVKLSAIAYRQNNFSDMAYFSPFYLKSPNITTPKKNIL